MIENGKYEVDCNEEKLGLNREIRLRVLKGYIWSDMIYGCESWTIISKEMRKSLKQQK